MATAPKHTLNTEVHCVISLAIIKPHSKVLASMHHKPVNLFVCVSSLDMGITFKVMGLHLRSFAFLSMFILCHFLKQFSMLFFFV